MKLICRWLAFLLGFEELDRAIFLAGTGPSEATTQFVTPEEILLPKLHWFSAGGDVPQVQWRGVQGIIGACGSTLDRGYLERSAAKLGLLAGLYKLSANFRARLSGRTLCRWCRV